MKLTTQLQLSADAEKAWRYRSTPLTPSWRA